MPRACHWCRSMARPKPARLQPCLHPQDAHAQGGLHRPASAALRGALVDGEDRNDVAPGELGQVLVTRRQPHERLLEATGGSAPALAGGWFHSGDIGHLDAEGYLYVDGRSKDMIISGGENIAPAEIENLLLGCDDIAEASHNRRPDTRWGQIVVAGGPPRQPGSLTEAGRCWRCWKAASPASSFPRKSCWSMPCPRLRWARYARKTCACYMDPQR
jgi:acyl-CoA synthetase (AMP-forming)/AMP-acid ligase II